MRNNADRMIEESIAREFERYHSIFPDEAEKQAILKRIAELKAMLSPASEKVERKPITASEIVSAFVTAFRRKTH
jgi:hypothetical protein